MRKRVWLLLAIFTVALGGGLARAQNAYNDQPDTDGSKSLAERFALSAQQTLLANELTPAIWRQSAAMLEGACRLDPKNPRFARLLSDTYLQLNDVPKAIGAIRAYLAINSDTADDEVAQAQLIDLHLSQMEAADAKIAYCREITEKTPVPTQVRSHAAYRLATYLLSQSENQGALAALDLSLKLSDQLNMDALRMKWDLTATDATPAQRVELLLSMVRSNPSDPVVMSRLAEQAANSGLVTESLNWYNVADYLYSREGVSRDGAFVRGFGTEMALAGHGEDTLKLLAAYLKFAPSDAEAWFMAISIQQADAVQSKEKAAIDAADALKKQTAVALTNNMAEIRKILGVNGATTRPIESSDATVIPDLAGDFPLLQKSANAALIDAYINAASDLAWFELYYQHDAAAAGPLLQDLGKLLGDSDAVLTRLQGWQELITPGPEHAAAALAKLSSVQDRDAYAALGVYWVNNSDASKQKENLELAKSILAAHPSGATGLILWESLQGTSLAAQSNPSTDAVKKLLTDFPADFLNVIQQPSAFYAIRAEPLKSSYDFGEPVMVRVSVTNVSRYSLTIGGDGVIHPDLWFDAHLKGEADVPVSGVAFDRLGQRLVLPRDESISTVARVDGGVLTQVFMANPNKTMMLEMKVTTNPITIQPKDPKKDRPQAIPGPAGYQMPLTHMFERVSMPIATDAARKGLMLAAHGDDGAAKFLALQTMAVTVAGAGPEDKQQPEMKAILAAFTRQIHDAQKDPSLPVRTWANYLAIMITSDQAKSIEFTRMGDSKEWTDQMMALILSSHLSDGGLELAKTLSTEADPTVSSLARATLAQLRNHPTSRPTTAPAGEAAGGPAEGTPAPAPEPDKSFPLLPAN